MRKSALLLAVVALATVAPAGAGAGTGASVKGVGGGWIGFPFTSKRYVHFSFSAHSAATRDFGQLQFTIDDPIFPLDVSVDIDCVNVFEIPFVGGGGWFSGIVRSVEPEPNLDLVFTGDRLYFSILDGGEPSDAPVDSLEAWYDLGASCEALPSYMPPPDVTQGNIVVDTGS